MVTQRYHTHTHKDIGHTMRNLQWTDINLHSIGLKETESM